MSFRGKSVIITGTSAGIGSKTALLFAERGANITINYFSSREKAEEIVRNIGKLGVETFSFKANVSDPKEVSSMVRETVRRFGRIDVLVNNASKHPPPAFDFEKPDWGLWKMMAHTNIMGILVCSHFAAPYLLKNGGNIVNVVIHYIHSECSGGVVVRNSECRGGSNCTNIIKNLLYFSPGFDFLVHSE